MNHLAHLFLAGDDAESLIGNLSGDFVKGALGDRFTRGIRDGIMQHRAIDAFTDAHRATAAFRQVLIPEHGHYSRVIADMFFDHFLACRFDEYAGEPLEAFLARTFATIDPYADTLPGRLRIVYPHMRDEAWLPSYRNVESIHHALTQISRRFSRRPQLGSAARHLVDSRAQLEPLFEELFADVMQFAGKRRAVSIAPMRSTATSLQETLAPNSRCFGCGPANEQGLRIRSFEDGDALVCDWKAEPHHLAFPGVVNGGIIGSLLDCHSNWTAAVHVMKQRGETHLPPTVTADFHVTLKRPTPLDATLHLRAHVVEADGDRTVIEATLEANGKVTATCRGTFVAVKEGHPAYHRW